jgi:tripartite-type tricarboxylate transporter receptor subunit TctC
VCAIVPSAPRVLLLVLTAVLALAASIPHALAQSWPLRTVKLIIPLPPGTGTDIAGRLLAERLAGRWGQPVVVENKQGGDGIPAVAVFNVVEGHGRAILPSNRMMSSWCRRGRPITL